MRTQVLREDQNEMISALAKIVVSQSWLMKLTNEGVMHAEVREEWPQ